MKGFNLFLTLIYIVVFMLLLASLSNKSAFLYGFTLHGENTETTISDVYSEGRLQGLKMKEAGPLVNRRLFKSSGGYEKPVRLQDASAGQKDLCKDFSLVGILQDGTPKAIIEDKKSSKTYYLGLSDSIAGLELVEIRDGEVILEGTDARYRLTL